MLQNATPYRARQKKGEGKKLGLLSSLAFVGLLCLALATYFMYEVLCKTSVFMITETEIAGAQRIGQKEILALCELKLQANLLAVSPLRLRRQVEAHPWIERAEIKRKWPNRLIVQVKERQPVALAGPA